MRNPFKRQPKADEVTLPKEVQDYYEAEKRERVGVASMLAIGTLVVTVILALGIFFGGRWVWRHTLHHNPKTTTVATVKAPDDKTSSSSSTPSYSSSSSPTSSSSSNSSSSTSASSGSSTPSSTSSSTAPTPSPTPPAASSTTTGATTLPNTGPDSFLMAWMISMAIGFIAAELYQRRPLRD